MDLDHKYVFLVCPYAYYAQNYVSIILLWAPLVVGVELVLR